MYDISKNKPLLYPFRTENNPQNKAGIFISSIVFIFCLLYRPKYEEEKVTPLSKKEQKPRQRLNTCGSGNESDDNEFVESKKRQQDANLKQ